MVALQKLNAFYALISRAANFIIICGFLAVVYFASDRAPPFAILSSELAEARAGDEITIRATVRREVWRNCSVKMSRSMFDAKGNRTDFPVSHWSAQAIADMEKATPGRMAPSFEIPKKAEPGPAIVVSSLEYTCNRVHSWNWPIEVTTVMPFTILPP